MFASFRVFLCVIGYNTNLLKAAEAPRSFADLLDPKWAGKIVKAHPSYSGTILTATYQIARDIGWPYFENLARQKVMQVQSASDPPKKLALGERAIMADGIEYGMFQLKESGKPVEIDLSDRRYAAHHRSERHLQERTEPQRRSPVAELHAVGGVPAAQHRCRRHAFGPCADEGEGGAHAACRREDHEGRRRRGRKGERGDQGALHTDIQGVIDGEREWRHARYRVHAT